MFKPGLYNSRFDGNIIDEHREFSGRIDILEQKINLIIQKLDSVEKGTDKMTSHIDFINDIYSRIQTPLFWICDRINYMSGYNITHLEKQPITNKVSAVDDQD
jgi:hypothetical protein